MNRDHIGSLVETLKAVEDDDATDFILVFLERLAESGEDFNIEGICVEQHVSVLLHYFPNETAVHIVEILVRHSKDCAHVVFSLNGRASFLSFLEPQTVNLPCVIRFLAGFFLYDDFLSFNSQQLRPLLNLAVDGTDNEVTCAALEALIEASSWAALSSEFAASGLFAKLFELSEEDSTVPLRLQLLRNTLCSMSDPTQLLTDDDGTLIRFLKGCFTSTDDTVLSYSAEIAGIIASYGAAFVLHLIQHGMDEALFTLLQSGGSITLISCTVLAIVRFMLHCDSERRHLYVSRDLPTIVADILESSTDQYLDTFLSSLHEVVRVCAAAHDESILAITTNEAFLEAIHSLHSQATASKTSYLISLFMGSP